MPPAKPKALDAVALLKADHRAVEDLFEQFESARRADSKLKLARQICLELIVHTMIEEELFYPGVQGAVESDVMQEASVEHDGAKVLIAQIMAGGAEDPFFEAKVKVLSEEIKHHVKEEEQRDGMFAQAKKGGADLESLGQQMAERKAVLLKQFKSAGAPRPVTRSMTGAMPEVGPIARM